MIVACVAAGRWWGHQLLTAARGHDGRGGSDKITAATGLVGGLSESRQ